MVKKTYSKRRSLLPVEGIFFPDGTPFYHLNRRSLNEEQKKRLKECGIRIFTGRFTKEEDDNIRLNWYRYASDEGIDFDRAFEFSGGYRHLVRKGEEGIIFYKLQRTTKFLPRICKGLMDRTARQVTERMRRLFHPANNKPYAGSRDWTEDEMAHLKLLLEHHTPVPLIAIKLERTKKAVEAKMYALKGIKPLRKINSQDNQFHWNLAAKVALFTHVNCLLSRKKWEDGEIEEFKNQLYTETGGCDVIHLAMSSLRKANPDFFKLDRLAIKLGCTLNDVVSRWAHETSKIRKICVQCNGDPVMTMNMLGPRYGLYRQMTLREYQKILELILEQHVETSCRLDDELLQQRIEEEGLTGFYTKGLRQTDYVIRRLRRFIRKTQFTYKQKVSGLSFLNFNDWITCSLKSSKAITRISDDDELRAKKHPFRIFTKRMKEILTDQVEIAKAREKTRIKKLQDEINQIMLRRTLPKV